MRNKTTFLALLCLLFLANLAFAEERARFGQFSALLPEGWDGEEQNGFISNNAAEYQLTFGKKDESGDGFAAQLSIFLLPNRKGVTSREAAQLLAEAQANADEPAQSGDFWIFKGEPRTRAMQGGAITRVRTTPTLMLIIIAQDPQNLGAAEIFASLAGETEEARELLGR